MPAPSTDSTAALAFASRSGRSSGPGRSAADAATAALNRSWMVMGSPGVVDAEATHQRDDRQVSRGAGAGATPVSSASCPVDTQILNGLKQFSLDNQGSLRAVRNCR